MGCSQPRSTASRSTPCWRAERWPHLRLWSPQVRARWARPGEGEGPRLPLMLCPPTGPEQPVGPVTDLQATELPGQRVRVSWRPVPGATEYRVTVRGTQGEADTASTPPPTYALKFQPSGLTALSPHLPPSWPRQPPPGSSPPPSCDHCPRGPCVPCPGADPVTLRRYQ